MTCKNCIHSDICNNLRPIEYCMDKTCSHYIDKNNTTPVIHGRWLDTDTFDFHCIHIYQCSSYHKEVADDYISYHKYCLHCGAKMDEGDD